MSTKNIENIATTSIPPKDQPLNNFFMSIKKPLTIEEKEKFLEKSVIYINRVQGYISWLKRVGVQPKFLKYKFFTEEKMDLIESISKGCSSLSLQTNDIIAITKILSTAHEVDNEQKQYEYEFFTVKKMKLNYNCI